MVDGQKPFPTHTLWPCRDAVLCVRFPKGQWLKAPEQVNFSLIYHDS
jgi:hypothetical protein